MQERGGELGSEGLASRMEGQGQMNKVIYFRSGGRNENIGSGDSGE